MSELAIPTGGDRSFIPALVSNLHASGLGEVDAREAAAAAAEELKNPEGEDEGSVLLHGPVIGRRIGPFS